MATMAFASRLLRIAALPSRTQVPCAVRRFSSTPLFEGETVELYRSFFQQLEPSWTRHVAAVKHHAGATAPKDILDLASGPGQPAMLLSKSFPAARILCTDVSPDMVAQASAAVQESNLSNVECRVLDMCDMTNVATSSVDVVTVSYGLMFAPDLDRALGEIHRVLRPGGVLVSTTWREMPMMGLVRSVMTKVLGREPPPPPIDPLSLADDAALDAPLAAAGLRLEAEEVGQLRFHLGSDDDRSWRLGTLPVLAKLKELVDEGDASAMERARASFFEEAAPWREGPDGGIVTPNAIFRLTVATKPKA